VKYKDRTSGYKQWKYELVFNFIHRSINTSQCHYSLSGLKSIAMRFLLRDNKFQVLKV